MPETMLGPMTNTINPMKMSGKITLMPSVLIIWIQLKTHLLKLKTLIH